jgi:hypothetical protein
MGQYNVETEDWFKYVLLYRGYTHGIAFTLLLAHFKNKYDKRKTEIFGGLAANKFSHTVMGYHSKHT